MQSYYAFIALDLAREKAAEAEAQRLAALGRPVTARSLGVRRAIARFALAIAHAADDDLGRAALSTR
jgi:hypothetical protein